MATTCWTSRVVTMLFALVTLPICLLTIVVATTSTAGAVPGGTPTCRFTGGTPYEDENGNPGRHKYIYIESDFNVEMRESTPSTDDDTLTFEQVEHAIMQAAEIWNTQGRGTAYLYGGPLSVETPAQFCTYTSERPAVFIHFGKDSWDDSSASTGGAGCSGAGEIIFHARNENGLARNFPVGSQGARFVNAVVHELGHQIGLHHGHDVTPKSCYAVMSYPSCDSTKYSGGRHLKNYDKDCLTAFNDGPNAGSEPRIIGTVRGISSSGAFKGWYTWDIGQQKGFYGGPAIWPSEFTPGYALYFDWGSRWSATGYDGYFNWSSFNYIWGAPTEEDIDRLDVGPLIFGVRDHGWSHTTNGTRVAFLDDENDSDPSIMYSPPRVQYVRTDEELYSSSGDFNLWECGASEGSCTNATRVRSHLPIAAAWDPVSERTIIGRVLSDTETEGDDQDGQIELFPGFISSSNYQNLRRGVWVSGSFSGTWPADASTDQPIGLACGDSGWPSTYNCMVAWVDKDQYQGELRYNYFRVTSSNNIEFDGNFTTRGGADTAAGPAVAFIGGEFWLAFRDLEQTTVTYQTSSSAYSWGTVGWDGTFPIVEGPTFMHRNGREAAMYFGKSY